MTWRHNDGRDEWKWLFQKALPPSSISTKPYLFHGAGFQSGQCRGATNAAEADGPGNEARGYVMARGFWSWRRQCVFDI